MSVIIRADASKEIGAGHLMRCLSLAEGLSERGVQSLFWTRTDHPPFLAAIEKKGFQWVAVPPSSTFADEPALLSQMPAFSGVNGIFVDRYELPGDYFENIHTQKPKWAIGTFDDWGRPVRNVDLILNQNLSADTADYGPALAAGVKVLTGPRYALLRSEFRSHKPKPWSPTPVKNIVITFGGADTVNATFAVLKALDGLDASITRHVILGAAYQHAAQVEAYAAGKSHVRVVKNAQDMVAELTDKDLSITGSGSTMWEIYYMGVPNIFYTLVDNQEANGAAAAAAGTSVGMGRFEDFNANALLSTVERLIASPEDRERLSMRGHAAVDGQGVDRVAQAFVGLLC